jgi:hypothetical protein
LAICAYQERAEGIMNNPVTWFVLAGVLAIFGPVLLLLAESSEPRLDRIEVTSRDAAITLQAGEEFGGRIMLHVHAGVINFVDEDFALQVVKPYCYGRWYFAIEGYADCLRRALS